MVKSATAFNLPPLAPVNAMVLMPIDLAFSIAATTLPELPLVEIPIKTSPDRPNVST